MARPTRVAYQCIACFRVGIGIVVGEGGPRWHAMALSGFFWVGSGREKGRRRASWRFRVAALLISEYVDHEKAGGGGSGG